MITLPLYLIFLNRATKLCFYVSVPCSSSLIVKDVPLKRSRNTTEANRFAEGEEEHRSISIPIKLSSTRSSAVQLCALELRRHRMCLTLLPYAMRRNPIRESPGTDPLPRPLPRLWRWLPCGRHGSHPKIEPQSPRRRSKPWPFLPRTCPPCHLPPLSQCHLSLFLPVTLLVLYCPLSLPAVDRRNLSRLWNTPPTHSGVPTEH